MKRKKRLKKGIDSIEEQIKLHELKLKEAEELDQEELVQYLHKDLARLRRQKEQKEEKFEKQ